MEATTPVSVEDKEAATRLLASAAGDGQIPLDDFHSRINLIFEARTVEDLQRAFSGVKIEVRVPDRQAMVLHYPEAGSSEPDQTSFNFKYLIAATVLLVLIVGLGFLA